MPLGAVAAPATRYVMIAFLEGTVLVGAPGEADRAGAFYRFGTDASGGWTGSTRISSSTLEGPAGFAASAMANTFGWSAMRSLIALPPEVEI